MRGKENGVPNGDWLRRTLFYFDEVASIMSRTMPPDGELGPLHIDMRAVTGIRRKLYRGSVAAGPRSAPGSSTYTREFARTPEELMPADGREQCAA